MTALILIPVTFACALPLTFYGVKHSKFEGLIQLELGMSGGKIILDTRKTSKIEVTDIVTKS